MAHIVDTALEKRAKANNPVKVCLVGAGFMATGLVMQIEKYTAGMLVSCIVNRTVERAKKAYGDADVPETDVSEVKEADQLDSLLSADPKARTVCASDNFEAIINAKAIDCVLEVTGDVDYGARIALASFAAKKHVIAMNAELDGTIGPILKKKADEAGVVFSNSDGDQPGVILNLWRWVKAIGLRPVLCGNIKGFHNVRRNPETQKSFAEATKQNVHMVTSFCDGTKVSFEMAVVANATGMSVQKREMNGPDLDAHVDFAHEKFDLEDIVKDKDHAGIVDYIVMAKPNKPPGGIFVLGHLDDPKQAHYFKYYKMGDGPLYTFYTPYHLCHFEVALSCARAVLFDDAVCTPAAGPRVDVITKAKKDLKKGDVLDGIGGFLTYGVAENSDETRKERHLPMGLSVGCVLTQDIAMDELITFDQVELPEGGRRLCDNLWREQDSVWFSEESGAAAAVDGVGAGAGAGASYK